MSAPESPLSPEASQAQEPHLYSHYDPQLLEQFDNPTEQYQWEMEKFECRIRHRNRLQM